MSEGEDSIKVLVRIRPNESPDQLAAVGECPPTPRSAVHSVRDTNCFEVDCATISVAEGRGAQRFTFDHVATQDSDQALIFNTLGEPMIASYLEGYNATVFAYGQTGAGKTFTMQGPSEESGLQDGMRGLIPRTLESLYNKINENKMEFGSKVDYKLRCSFLEIYNEQVYDLLDPGSNRSLLVREANDKTKTVYVEGLSQTDITSAEEAYEVLSQGWMNRRVASTNMNRESSRSHSLFTLHLETKRIRDDGIVNIRSSKLNLIDLAGSERQKDTKAVGERIKEAGSINKSLSAIGNVITALVDISRGKTRHIPYRDSTLSFLLRDSLGGNSKTYIIACVHPGTKCQSESVSTLRFAARAKLIKNHAVINEDLEGDVRALQNEIRNLKEVIHDLKSLPHDASHPGVAKETTKRSSDWKTEFVQAMMLRQKAEDEKNNLQEQVKALEEDLKRKDVRNEKTKLTHKMILKFRDDTIKQLEKQHKVDQTDDSKQREIEVLRQQLEVQEKNNKGTTLVLTQRISQMLEDTQLQQKITANINMARDLEAKLEEFLGTENIFPSLMQRDQSKEGETKLKEDLEKVEKKLNEKTKEWNDEKEKSEKQIKDLETRLKESLHSYEELNNALNATKLKSKIEREELNKEHISTIQSMTPKSCRKDRRKTIGGKIAMNLEESYCDMIDAEDPGDGLHEESMPKEQQTSEDADTIEAQCIRIEELTRQLQNLQEVKSDVDELQEKSQQQILQLQEKNKTSATMRNDLEKMLKSAVEGLEEIQQVADVKEEALKQQQEEIRVLKSEVEDLRMMEAQSARRLVEIRTECDTLIDGKERQIEEFEEKIRKSEEEVKLILEEKEEALKNALEQQDQKQRLQDEVDSLHTSLHRLVADKAEVDESLKDVTEAMIAVETQLAQEMETNDNLKQDMSIKGKEIDVRLLQMTIENEETKKTSSTLEANLQESDTKLKDIEKHLTEAEERLKMAEKQNQDINKVLTDVQQNSSAYKDEVKRKEEELETKATELQDRRRELSEAAEKLDQSLQKEEHLNFELNETRKKLSAQKQAHDFKYESLQEDIDELNEMYATLKSELDAAMTDLKDANEAKGCLETENEDLKTELEEKRHWLRAKETEAATQKEGRRQTMCPSNAEFIRQCGQENIDLKIRQTELLTRIDVYESRREEKDKEILSLRIRLEQNEADRLGSDEMKNRNDGLKAELEFARKNQDTNDQLVQKITAQADVANQERENLEALCRNIEEENKEKSNLLRQLQTEVDEEKEAVRKQRETLCKELAEVVQSKEKMEKMQNQQSKTEEELAYWKCEYEKAQQENGRLLGHQNPHQKINYLVDLKNKLTTLQKENNAIKKDLYEKNSALKQLKSGSALDQRSRSTGPKSKENLRPVKTEK